MNKLQAADMYIQQHKEKVQSRPLLHFTAETGWINDPNGFSFYKGEYHLFYQYNPYDVVWSDMHWGHVTTRNFIDWTYQPVALANDKVYDANGCFSGSAIEKDGKLYLMYTGHIDPNMGFDKDESQIIQQQCVAVSEDGIHFEKYAGNPVIGIHNLPEGYLICDFRDPKVVEHDGVYYVVLAVRNAARRGEILMFKSDDMLNWNFHASIYQTAAADNIMLECPDLFRLDGRDVLLFSIMPCDPEFAGEVTHKTAYVIGEMDYEAGRFHPASEGLLDSGNSFYAPQSAAGKNGERLLIGWMQSWKQAHPPREYGFNGMMSLPRELRIQGQTLLQQPAKEVREHFGSPVVHEKVALQTGEALELAGGKAGYLRLEVSGRQSFQVELHKGKGKSTRLEVDAANGSLRFISDYGESEAITLSTDLTALEIFTDVHSVEVFVNAGEQVLSFTAYDPDKGQNVCIRGLGEAMLEKVVYAVK
ncbi:glycoside hydrolase family 32 protein [Ectobacillus ponti]|uniref:beta-fructofuranosidase n=1 Tax=Ectobacillus ponti TaxID=2961894 RepID=A0AA42BUM5_9BACI|nr:glycoside hydrolase family 32 protein [Ectobacillus ponti]MCP8970678.1 glycoside hydrolase family 32 protein [Ectobacillus ponti]